MAAADQAASGLRAYLDEAIAARHSQPAQADVIGRLLAMQADEATALSDEQIRTNLFGLITGFIPTVATATTFAIDALLGRPDALAAAQQAARSSDPDLVRSHMWEAMRLAPQGPGVVRRASTDFVLAEGTHRETTIPFGTLTFAATQSAMLDGDVVDHPVSALRHRHACLLRPLRERDADPVDRTVDPAHAGSCSRRWGRGSACQGRAVPRVAVGRTE